MSKRRRDREVKRAVHKLQKLKGAPVCPRCANVVVPLEKRLLEFRRHWHCFACNWTGPNIQ